MRFFAREENSYRIRKPIRDLVVFAKQDVNKDPPFSKMDLISCRNLPIYLQCLRQIWRVRQETPVLPEGEKTGIRLRR